MFPIFEQGGGHGIGHGLDSFLKRVDEVFAQHRTEGRAKAFALILYDFENKPIKQILKNQGVFAKLDRLSGNEISIFYLHTGKRQAIDRFNSELLRIMAFSVPPQMPCIIFFKFDRNSFEDIKAVELESPDLINGFGEIDSLIKLYLEQNESEYTSTFDKLAWIKSAAKFVSLEALKDIIQKAVEHFPR